MWHPADEEEEASSDTNQDKDATAISGGHGHPLTLLRNKARREAEIRQRLNDARYCKSAAKGTLRADVCMLCTCVPTLDCRLSIVDESTLLPLCLINAQAI